LGSRERLPDANSLKNKSSRLGSDSPVIQCLIPEHDFSGQKQHLRNLRFRQPRQENYSIDAQSFNKITDDVAALL